MKNEFSVLISVYFKENPKYLDAALNSIWNEQTLKPSQIVLVEDGPLSEPLNDIILRWKFYLQENLSIIKLEKNVGLARALNEGLKSCKYDLVARMDSDDISLYNRFEKQVDYMNKFPEIAVSSATIEEWDIFLEKKVGVRKIPTDHQKIISFAKYRSPINHPCAIFRKSIIQKNNGYPEIYPEDYALWGILLNNGYKLNNLPDTLLRMRIGDALNKRRGLKFLKGEIDIFRLFLRIGFINKNIYYRNIIIRSILRLSPFFLKKFFYRTLR